MDELFKDFRKNKEAAQTEEDKKHLQMVERSVRDSEKRNEQEKSVERLAFLEVVDDSILEMGLYPIKEKILARDKNTISAIIQAGNAIIRSKYQDIKIAREAMEEITEGRTLASMRTELLKTCEETPFPLLSNYIIAQDRERNMINHEREMNDKTGNCFILSLLMLGEDYPFMLDEAWKEYLSPKFRKQEKEEEGD